MNSLSVAPPVDLDDPSSEPHDPEAPRVGEDQRADPGPDPRPRRLPRRRHPGGAAGDPRRGGDPAPVARDEARPPLRVPAGRRRPGPGGAGRAGRGVDRFDPERTSYSTFAWVTVSGVLRRHLRDLGWAVRPPRTLQESANRLRAVVPELTQDLGRTPRTADAAERLGWTPLAVREAEVANQGLRAASLDALVGDGGSVSRSRTGRASRPACCWATRWPRCPTTTGSCSGCASSRSSARRRSAWSSGSTRWASPASGPPAGPAADEIGDLDRDGVGADVRHALAG